MGDAGFLSRLSLLVRRHSEPERARTGFDRVTDVELTRFRRNLLPVEGADTVARKWTEPRLAIRGFDDEMAGSEIELRQPPRGLRASSDDDVAVGQLAQCVVELQPRHVRWIPVISRTDLLDGTPEQRRRELHL